MQFIDEPPPTAEMLASRRAMAELPMRQQPALPVLTAAFLVGALLTSRPGRLLALGLLRTGIMVARPALLAVVWNKIAQANKLPRS
jgi:hypothetical protein